MENVLLNYMEKRFAELQEVPCGPNPFVTISREFGCPSKTIGTMLVDRLNSLHKSEKHLPWRQVNKEIILESAQQLNLDPLHIKMIFQSGQTGVLDDILSSFYLNIKSNKRIKKTVYDVIRSFASKGYVVLVGRAGAAITQNCKNSLHIRLQAPIEWRVKHLVGSRKISIEEAYKLAEEMDKKRKLTIETLTGNKFDLHIFDMILNCDTLTKEEITGIILRMMEFKKMI